MVVSVTIVTRITGSIGRTLTKEAAFIKGLKIALRVTVPPLSSLAVFPEEGDKEVESEHETERK